MKSSDIRRQFIAFFESKGHAFVPSSPVVPHDDPTLMFTNAGMNQFKPIFLGSERATHPRVANSQKCIRAGGKHNDLDDVGQDTYHHTFFEMLGNWSFGDYFKKEAIAWAWELLTKVWGIDKTRLHATYFGGLPIANCQLPIEGKVDAPPVPNRQSEIGNRQSDAWELEPDNEAHDLWASVTDIDPSHIHPGNMKDNFWEMGDTGPCGPCSEIHIDLTPDKSGADLVNKGDARVMEIWNLVFIQYNRGSDGKLTPLPAKHVDTGMGFERLCAVLQKKTSNYDTDVFTPIFDAIRKRTNAPAYTGLLPIADCQLPIDRETDKSQIGNRKSEIGNPQLLVDVSYRVIADHLRCLTFALTDGAVPSNEGRGYVLRRILRRAVRYGRQYLNMHEPFLCDLVPTVVTHMADTFPELRSAHRGKNVEHVVNLIREEEESFLRTLDRGIRLFNEAAERANQSRERERADTLSSRAMISGEDAFKLHDTYGFPIDLTELMAEEQGMTIDVGEYERLMEEARERARGAEIRENSEVHVEALLAVHAKPAIVNQISDPSIRERVRKGECPDEFKFDQWHEHKTWIIGVGPRWVGSESALTRNEEVQVLTGTTCFYAEQGGQVSDTGTIVVYLSENELGGTMRVDRVRRVQVPGHEYERILHEGVVTSNTMPDGGRCRMAVTEPHRKAVTRNHTATHIMNWALREVLCPADERTNPHVQQKGSLVDPDKTRFDFSHNHPLSGEELSRIETLVKKQIGENLEVHDLLDGKREVEQKKAREINTLRAVFGEKYPDLVRVVSIGPSIKDMLADPKNAKWMQYSVEFCGGTHVKKSGEIGEFALVHEEGVAKGVRRVVGLTGDRAKEARVWGEHYLAVADALRRGITPPSPPLGKGGTQGGSDQSRGRKPADTSSPSETYDLSRFLKELSDATIPILTRHKLADSIAELQEAAKEAGKKSAAAAQRGAVEAVGELLASKAIDLGGVTVLVGEVPGGNADALRNGIDFVRNKKGSSAVLLAAVGDGKVTLVAGMSKDVVDRGIKAGDLIKDICPLVGGKGGGRPDMAQGGGTDAGGLPKALEKATEWIAAKLESR